MGCHRPHSELPAIAAAVIVGEIALDQCGIAPDRGEVRLRPLDGFLGSRCSVDGKHSAAARLEQPDECHRGDRQRYDNLE